METAKKALSIVGPTAVGKTGTALWLAERLLSESTVTGVDLIAADSRQVYRELPVLSGVDLPEDWIEDKSSLSHSFFSHPDLPISLHGVQIISCRDEWSAAHFAKFAQEVLESSWQTGRLPILVGGTGLYLQQLSAPAASLGVAPDLELRESLEAFTVPELQERLALHSPATLERLNHSDRNNSRRLIRAIEVASAQPPIAPEKDIIPVATVTTIGLHDELSSIAERITKRVQERFHSGAQREVERLLSDVAGISKPVLSTLGIKEITAFLEGEAAEEAVIEKWSRRELQYAKRQLTWLKKYGNATWFSVASPNFREALLTKCLLTS